MIPIFIIMHQIRAQSIIHQLHCMASVNTEVLKQQRLFILCICQTNCNKLQNQILFTDIKDLFHQYLDSIESNSSQFVNRVNWKSFLLHPLQNSKRGYCSYSDNKHSISNSIVFHSNHEQLSSDLKRFSLQSLHQHSFNSVLKLSNISKVQILI